MKQLNKAISNFLVILLFFALSANASGISSDFIDDLPEMKPDIDSPGALVWEKAGFDRAAYTKVLIEPVVIFVDPKSPYKGIDAHQMKALSDDFHQVIVEVLEPDIPVVDKGGEGVLYVRAALTNVQLEKIKHGLLSYTPIGFAMGKVMEFHAVNIDLIDAVLEAEVFDSKTGERLMVLIDTKPKPSEMNTEKDEMKFSYDTVVFGTETGKMDTEKDEKKQLSREEIYEALRFYARRFLRRVEQAR